MNEKITILEAKLAEALQVLALWRHKEILPNLFPELVARTDEVLNSKD